jgi:hypothetical protein
MLMENSVSSASKIGGKAAAVMSSLSFIVRKSCSRIGFRGLTAAMHASFVPFQPAA